MTMIPLMALVTLMRGVWREGVTFQITMYPAVRILYSTNENGQDEVEEVHHEGVGCPIGHSHDEGDCY